MGKIKPMLTIFLAGWVTLLSCRAGPAFAAIPDNRLRLIPTPKKLELTEDNAFKLTAETAIVFDDPANQEDQFAVQQLIEEVQKETSLKLPIVPGSEKPAIIIGRWEQGEKTAQIVLKRKIILPEKAKPQGYFLSIRKDGIVLVGADAAGLFYGVQTLRQLIRGNLTEPNELGGCDIIDEPHFECRGWQDDATLGPVPTPDFLRHQIRTLSEYKLNLFKLKAKIITAPESSPSGYTPEQIQELFEYGKRYHVEMAGDFVSDEYGVQTVMPSDTSSLVICPGDGCGAGIWPDYRPAFGRTANYMQDANEQEMAQPPVSMRDSEGENLFSNNWLPLLWGAEWAWNPIDSEEDEAVDELLNQRLKLFLDHFDAIFYGAAGAQAAQTLWQLSDLRDYPDSDNLSKTAFWQDFFAYPFGSAYLPDPQLYQKGQLLSQAAEEIIERLITAKSKARYRPDSLDGALLAARRVQFMARRMITRAALDRRFQAENRNIRIRTLIGIINPGAFSKSLEQLAGQAHELKAEYEQLWKRENHPRHLAKNLAKYDRMIEQLQIKPAGLLIVAEDRLFVGEIMVSLVALAERGEIYFTINGGEPTPESIPYLGSFRLTNTAMIKAGLFRINQDRPLLTAMASFAKVIPRQPDKPVSSLRGLNYEYYEGELLDFADFNSLEPAASGRVGDFDLKVRRRDENCGLRFYGYIRAPFDGVFTFYTQSTGGSQLFIGNRLIVNNAGADQQAQGQIALRRGLHEITALYLQRNAEPKLQISYRGPGFSRQPVPAEILFR